MLKKSIVKIYAEQILIGSTSEKASPNRNVPLWQKIAYLGTCGQGLERSFIQSDSICQDSFAGLSNTRTRVKANMLAKVTSTLAL